jgi:hypothetical protein
MEPLISPTTLSEAPDSNQRSTHLPRDVCVPDNRFAGAPVARTGERGSSMKHVFGFLATRRAPQGAPRKPRRFRPSLECLEGRTVPSVASMAAPALASAAPTIQQAASLLPISVNSVSITGVANNVLQLVANATTPNGHTFQIPLTLTNTTPNATTPILDLHVGAVHLDLLGLKVDTSDICLAITAQSGSGNLLGNLLSDVTHLLDQGLSLDQILGSLTGQLGNLSSGLSGLLNGALGAIGSPTNAATGGASVISTGTTRILDLSLGPVDLNLLGLDVHLDNCNNGPITVDITAQSGPGKLLGNLLGGLSHLLDSSANTRALLNKLDKIAGEIAAIL